MSQSNIRVAVRSRPLVDALKEKWAPGIELKGNRILMGNKLFDPDVVFQPETTQEAVFEECQPILDSVINGRNGTIMVYGQTGTGKTHTMLGDSDENLGIAFRAIGQLLAYVRKAMTTQSAVIQRAALSLSMIEIYNEKLTDMLHADSAEVYLAGGLPRDTVKIPLTTVEEAVATVRKALRSRHVSPTAMNERSSRSHVIVILDYTTTTTTTTLVNGSSSAEDLEEHVECSRLYLVDLAGSECVKKSQAVGRAAAEAGMINKSLLALRNVVLALTSQPGNVKAYVPYRDSKLTEMLQDSVGGTARTMLIACISPVARDIEETKSTLEYATRARKVKNTAADEREKLVSRIRSLEWQLQAQINKNGGTVQISKEEHADFLQLRAHNEDLQAQLELLSGSVTRTEALCNVRTYEHKEMQRVLSETEKERAEVAAHMMAAIEGQARWKRRVLSKLREYMAKAEMVALEDEAHLLECVRRVEEPIERDSQHAAAVAFPTSTAAASLAEGTTDVAAALHGVVPRDLERLCRDACMRVEEGQAETLNLLTQMESQLTALQSKHTAFLSDFRRDAELAFREQLDRLMNKCTSQRADVDQVVRETVQSVNWRQQHLPPAVDLRNVQTLVQDSCQQVLRSARESIQDSVQSRFRDGSSARLPSLLKAAAAEFATASAEVEATMFAAVPSAPAAAVAASSSSAQAVPPQRGSQSAPLLLPLGSSRVSNVAGSVACFSKDGTPLRGKRGRSCDELANAASRRTLRDGTQRPFSQQYSQPQ